MIDEKIIYGGLTPAEREVKKVQYWAWAIYQDLVALNQHLHEAKKEVAAELGILAELDVPNLIEAAKQMGEIDLSKMANMDEHRKVKWQPDAA